MLTARISRGASQFITYAGLSGVIVGLTIAARRAYPLLFQRFIGGADPVIAVTGICAVGAVLLFVLWRRDGFDVVRSQPAPGLLRAAGLASLFGLVVIAVDFAIVHPADMNVPFPQSLLFYPVMALMVEILFHALPLALLLTIAMPLVPSNLRPVIVPIGLVIVASLEPSYQLAAALTGAPVAGAPYTYTSATLAFDSAQVFAINLSQLWLFRRYDFMSMCAMRLVYYAIWHIAWGHARLSVLF